MTCLFSPSPFGCFLGLVPWWVWALLTLAAVLLAWGFAEKLVRLFRAFAGWQGVAAAGAVILAIVGAVASIFRGRPKPVRTEEQYPDPGERQAGPKPPRPAPKRRYNSDTNQWEDLP